MGDPIVFWTVVIVVGGVFLWGAGSAALLLMSFKNQHQQKRTFTESNPFGHSGFATEQEIEKGKLFSEEGVRIGYYKRDENTRRILRYPGPSHLLLVAPARSGKARDVLVPALLEYKHSCIVIDPKGELAAITARQRRALCGEENVIILNPFEDLRELLGASKSFNPMILLDPSSPEFGTDCDSLADAIVQDPGGEGSHWAQSARQLISGLIMAHAAYAAEDQKNLVSVREIVSGPIDELAGFARLAAKKGDPVIRGKLARFASANEETKELQSIVSAAITQTEFIGSATAMIKNLSTSSFSFSDLRRRPTTIYVVLPTRYLETCSRWFRLLVASALTALVRPRKSGDQPVLLMLDEFAQLGRLGAIENAMSQAAGQGVQLWPVLQNLAQLEQLYQKNYETFLSGAGIQQFFPPRDATTAEYVSKLCGKTTKNVHGMSQREVSEKEAEGGFSGISISTSKTEHPFLTPDDVRRGSPNRSLIMADTMKNVINAGRQPYWDFPAFKGLYDPNPYAPEPRV